MLINADSSQTSSNLGELVKPAGENQEKKKITILCISYSGIQSNLSCSSTSRNLMEFLFFIVFVLGLNDLLLLEKLYSS